MASLPRSRASLEAMARFRNGPPKLQDGESVGEMDLSSDSIASTASAGKKVRSLAKALKSKIPGLSKKGADPGEPKSKLPRFGFRSRGSSTAPSPAPSLPASVVCSPRRPSAYASPTKAFGAVSPIKGQEAPPAIRDPEHYLLQPPQHPPPAAPAAAATDGSPTEPTAQQTSVSDTEDSFLLNEAKAHAEAEAESQAVTEVIETTPLVLDTEAPKPSQPPEAAKLPEPDAPKQPAEVAEPKKCDSPRSVPPLTEPEEANLTIKSMGFSPHPINVSPSTAQVMKVSVDCGGPMATGLPMLAFTPSKLRQPSPRTTPLASPMISPRVFDSSSPATVPAPEVARSAEVSRIPRSPGGAAGARKALAMSTKERLAQRLAMRRSQKGSSQATSPAGSPVKPSNSAPSSPAKETPDASEPKAPEPTPEPKAAPASSLLKKPTTTATQMRQSAAAPKSAAAAKPSVKSLARQSTPYGLTTKKTPPPAAPASPINPKKRVELLTVNAARASSCQVPRYSAPSKASAGLDSSPSTPKAGPAAHAVRDSAFFPPSPTGTVRRSVPALPAVETPLGDPVASTTPRGVAATGSDSKPMTPTKCTTPRGLDGEPTRTSSAARSSQDVARRSASTTRASTVEVLQRSQEVRTSIEFRNVVDSSDLKSSVEWRSPLTKPTSRPDSNRAKADEKEEPVELKGGKSATYYSWLDSMEAVQRAAIMTSPKSSIVSPAVQVVATAAIPSPPELALAAGYGTALAAADEEVTQTYYSSVSQAKAPPFNTPAAVNTRSSVDAGDITLSDQDTSLATPSRKRRRGPLRILLELLVGLSVATGAAVVTKRLAQEHVHLEVPSTGIRKGPGRVLVERRHQLHGQLEEL